MKKILLFSLLCSLANAAPNYYAFISKSEGVRLIPYKCSMGFDTVGVGHKFEIGEKIKARYSESEIRELFNQDLRESMAIAKNVFPSFDSQPDEIKLILVSLSFNLGKGGINKFKKFRAAIEAKNYKQAARELKDSRWYSQVGLRGKKYVSILNSIK
jgi:lysozyme